MVDLRGLLKRIVVPAADLLLPPTCNFCGAELTSPAGQPFICADCRDAFLAFDGPVCTRCAAPVSPVHAGGDCPRCCHRRYHFRSATALGIYRGVLRDAVIRMKRSAAEPLTLSMGFMFAEKLRDWLSGGHRPDLLAPVPCHWIKRLVRGVNGPDLLVEAMGATLGIATATDLLRCRRRTRKQGTLLASERFANVRDAFAVSSGYDIGDAHVLLVDDIMTTGATASEAAKMLRKAGAATVDVAIVARGAGLQQRGS